MSDKSPTEWILPAAIPFAELKASDLEECVYWLFDAMGAKDLEWRTGGKGGGAADGGRDLEARFFSPALDGEPDAQRWWVECKGRSTTVEPDAVKSACNSALAISDLDYLVIATNTQFSNPTRDWVKEWQKAHPRPKVRLWDHTQLERFLSKHPDVVLRLFADALSLQGRFQAMESRFWNKLEFATPKTLATLWGNRNDIEFSAMGAFALVTNEFGGGSINHRPWAAAMDTHSLTQALNLALINVGYLMIRCSNAGIDQNILCRAYAHLILVLLDRLPTENVARLVMDSLNRGEDELMPEDVQEMLLMPVIDQLLSEMQDVCSTDCDRMMMLDRNVLTDDNDEVKDYWLRLEPDGQQEPDSRRVLRIEKLAAPCKVGFKTDKDHRCPLFEITPSVKNTKELLGIIEKVVTFRKTQARDARKSTQD